MLSLRRYLAVYYAYAFLFDFVFAYAIYTALFELEGLSVTEIGGLIAFWSITAILFEVPTGALSDHLDRRVLLVLAPLIKALTFVVWGLADGSVWLYGLGFALWSAGAALFSGTGEALSYERLAHDGEAQRYDEVNGRVGAAESLGIASGLVCGGLLAAVDMQLTLWWSIPPMLLASALALWLQDTRRLGAKSAAYEGAETEPELGYFDRFADGFAEFRRSPDLRAITLYIAGGLILFEILEEFDQLYYLAVQLPLWLFGFVGAATLGAHALASALAHRLRDAGWVRWFTPALGGVLFAVASRADNAWYVIVLELAYVVAVPATVLAEARFQALIDGSSRATATSMMVMAQNVIGIVVTLGFGALADAVGIRAAYGWAALWLVPTVLWAMRDRTWSRA